MRVILVVLISWFSVTQAQTPAVEPVSDLDAAHLTADPQLHWGVDPFSKDPGYHLADNGVDDSDPSKYQLAGIVFDEQHPMAIVNGKVVSINAFVGSRQVVEIGKNYVVLEADDSRIELQLPPVKESRAEVKAVDPSGGKQ